jgi:two-component system response regulator
MTGGNDARILLVEDRETDAELAIRALRKHNLGNHLLWVRNGGDAVDYLFARGAYANREHGSLPRLILLDLDLPVLNGLEVLGELKANESTEHIPVVVFTASEKEQDVAQCYKLGVNSYVNKPADSEEFAKVMAELGLYWLLINHAPQPNR